MSPPSTGSRVLLSLVVPPVLEEPLVDWLLDFDAELGFDSFPLNGHSSHHRDLSLAEQVTGRRRRVRFELELSEAVWPELIAKLQLDFAGAGLQFRVTPILAQGLL